MGILKKDIPIEVFDNFRDNKSIFFVGAGLSMGAGLPGWGKLLKGLIKEAKQYSLVSSDKIEDYNLLVKDNSKFLLLAEDIKNELGEKYYEYMENIFGKPDITPTPTLLSLVKIKTDIILTTNYDRLIENAYNKVYKYHPQVFTYSQSKEAANSYWKQKFFILKVHGDAFNSVEGLIFSQRDYRKTLYREFGYKSLLQAIFSTKSIVFIGTSMTDPEFNLLLDYLHESHRGGGPTHYLLAEKNKANMTLQRRYMEEFKIHTITYENKSKSHLEIKKFLDIINREIKK